MSNLDFLNSGIECHTFDVASSSLFNIYLVRRRRVYDKSTKKKANII